MPAISKANPTDRKTAAVIVSLLQGPLTKPEKEMLDLIAAELVSFRITYGASGEAVLGKEAVDWSAHLALRCTLRKLEKDIAQLAYLDSIGLDLSDIIKSIQRHNTSALQLAKDIKEV